MPKASTPKKTPKLDMNPMVDMAFLLVSFFMLTTTFKTAEPVLINRPEARSEMKVPETNVVKITIGNEGEVFFSVDGKFARKKLLDLIGQRYEVSFTPTEAENFALTTSFGLSVEELKTFLQLPPNERQTYPQEGIPCDSLRNELLDWIVYARMANPRVRFAINADKDTAYQDVNNVIKALLKLKIYRFNLVTELEKEI